MPTRGATTLAVAVAAGGRTLTSGIGDVIDAVA